MTITCPWRSFRFIWTFLMRGEILAHILVWGGLLVVEAMLILVTILAYTVRDVHVTWVPCSLR